MTEKRSVTLFIATSLDGYIATKDESLDWLFDVEGEGDNGYSEFYETVDTVLMGRKTYDWIREQQPNDFPYKEKECYVFTRSEAQDTEDVRFTSENLVEFMSKLKQKNGGRIWIVGGASLLQSFITENLVDELIITVAPKVIGEGIPLFKESKDQLHLSLKGTRTFNQFVELHYEVVPVTPRFMSVCVEST